MTERPKVHDWKSCVVKATGGSNPPLSASHRLAYNGHPMARGPGRGHGEMAERSKASDSKSDVVRATGGSNPSLSANAAS